jgi:vacuolar-type H+-ATPase subunit H
MQEIIDEVLKVEEEANGVVSKAQETALQMKTDADNELNNRIKDAREESRQSISREVEKARAAADSEYREAIDRANREKDKFLGENRDRIKEIVGEIADLIITPEYDRK